MRKIDLRSEIAKHVILTLIVLTWISTGGKSQSLIKTKCPESIMDDRDGKEYRTVQIGKQCWMAQNLNVGTMISGEYQTNNVLIEKYCYNNILNNCDFYGGLYQWDEMMQYSTTQEIQGICPSGWHVPSDAEWTTLENFVSNQPAYLCNNDTNYIAKALASTTTWNTSSDECAVGNNLATNNASGFSGLPAGYFNRGEFISQGYYFFFWSATQVRNGYAWGRWIGNSYGFVLRDDYGQSQGFSVRCLKDNPNIQYQPNIQLQVNPLNQNVSDASGRVNFEIISNTNWIIEETVDWFSVNQNSGSNNATITVSYEENTSSENRVGEITISAESGWPVVVITIKQYGIIIIPGCGQNITDNRDGKVYSTVKIGTQCWMAQNLNIGTMIISGYMYQTNNDTIEKYCYNNADTNCNVYGGLYKWNEMMQYSTTPGIQGICPSGWHVPSDAEWTTLENFMNSQPEYLCNNKTGYFAKALASKTYWDTITGECLMGNNLAANNATGFSGLPAGYHAGAFSRQGSSCFFWSASEKSTTDAWYRVLVYGSGYMARRSDYKSHSYSVRCLKDN